jgi:hypothetical protein
MQWPGTGHASQNTPFRSAFQTNLPVFAGSARRRSLAAGHVLSETGAKPCEGGPCQTKVTVSPTSTLMGGYCDF